MIYEVTITESTERPLQDVSMAVTCAPNQTPRLRMSDLFDYQESDIAVEYAARFLGVGSFTLTVEDGVMYG